MEIKVVRLVSLPGHKALCIGHDFNELLEKGFVYELVSLDGGLMLKKIGPSALKEKEGENGVCTNSSIDRIVDLGSHLLLSTDAEQASLVAKKRVERKDVL